MDNHSPLTNAPFRPLTIDLKFYLQKHYMKTILIKLSQCLMIALFLACLNQRAYSQYSQDGLRGLNATVFAAAVDTNGNLYVGGEFTKAGGASAQYDAMLHTYCVCPNFGDAFASSIGVWNPSE